MKPLIVPFSKPFNELSLLMKVSCVLSFLAFGSGLVAIAIILMSESRSILGFALFLAFYGLSSLASIISGFRTGEFRTGRVFSIEKVARGGFAFWLYVSLDTIMVFVGLCFSYYYVVHGPF